MSIDLAYELAATLPSGREGLFNPYADRCPLDADVDDAGPEGRIRRLAAHLARSPRFVLLGEAPGYQGCRYSGVAFTSERQLLEGVIPGIEALRGRLTTRERSFAEPSATIVWKALYKLRLQEEVITWNALQMHPFRGGDFWTNRTPTGAELQLGHAALALLRKAYPRAGFVAVGKKAAGLLADAGVTPVATVRHPGKGGANEFNQGMADLASSSVGL